MSLLSHTLRSATTGRDPVFRFRNCVEVEPGESPGSGCQALKRKMLYSVRCQAPHDLIQKVCSKSKIEREERLRARCKYAWIKKSGQAVQNVFGVFLPARKFIQRMSISPDLGASSPGMSPPFVYLTASARGPAIDCFHL